MAKPSYSQRKLTNVITASQIAKEMAIPPKGINSRKTSTKGKVQSPVLSDDPAGTHESGFKYGMSSKIQVDALLI